MASDKYETVIGLEVHVQLQTESKLFCSSSTQFGAEPNTQTTEVSFGLPGSLPVLNEKALEYGIQIALGINCKIAERLKFDRKHYFYPDLPKAYQISQFDMPLSYEGYLDVTTKDNDSIRVRINRAHLEEDAGKLDHESHSDGSLVDYNRAGIPLLEIVTEPDLKTPEQAYAYLTLLKSTIKYIGVSDCSMEQGSLRCDANISIRPKGQKELGTKTEIKNLNSFKAVARSLQYEIDRQTQVVESGDRVVQETRLWNDAKQKTVTMRSKEEAHDYRFFPEPDLVPFTISREKVEELKKLLPELPQAREHRFVKEFQLSEYDAQVLVSDKKTADYYEVCVNSGADPKKASNWLTTELLGILNARKESLENCKVTPESLSLLLQMMDKQVINGKIAKEILPEMVETGNSPEDIVKDRGMEQVSDTGLLEELAKNIINANPKSVEDFKLGKKNAISFLVGQMMKETKGKANPAIVNQLLQKTLSEM